MLSILDLRLFISVKEAKPLQSEVWLPPQCYSPKSRTPSPPAPLSPSSCLAEQPKGSKDDLLTCFPQHRLGNHKVSGCMSETLRFLPGALFLSLAATTEPFIWNSPAQECSCHGGNQCLAALLCLLTHTMLLAHFPSFPSATEERSKLLKSKNSCKKCHSVM